MATFTAARASPTFPVAKPIGGGTVSAAWGTIEVTAAPIIADIYEMCRVPGGAVVIGGQILSDDLDTGTGTLDIDVGWAANGVDVANSSGLANIGPQPTGIVAGIKSEAGYNYQLAGVLVTDGPKTFAAETVITVTVVAAANVFTAGTLSVVVYYLNP
jgi:hypothetical protein